MRKKIRFSQMAKALLIACTNIQTHTRLTGILLMIAIIPVTITINAQDTIPPPQLPSLPIVENQEYRDLNHNSISFGGTVIDIGGDGEKIIERGVCWSITPDPNINGPLKISISIDSTNSFRCNIGGLESGVTYYCKAYAVNSASRIGYSEQTTFITPLVIGGLREGGIIFSMDGNGGGMVCSAEDLGVVTWWDAKEICQKYKAEGWHLPSKEELNLMYKNLYMKGMGDFDEEMFYWSSRQVGNYFAWVQGFSSGFQYNDYKGYVNSVRAVKAF